MTPAAGPPWGKMVDMPHRPTINDVAAHAGVSKSLVSLALRGDAGVGEATRTRILESADALGYRSNILARGLRQGRTMTIGVVLSSLTNPYHTEVAAAVEEAAEHEGLSVLLAHGTHRRDRLEARIDLLLDLSVDGLVIVSSWIGAEALERAGRRAPVVMVGRTEDDVPGVDSVNNDDEHGASLAIDHFLAAGHTRIAHISASSRPSGAARRRGYLQAMDAAGLSGNARIIDRSTDAEALPTQLSETLSDGFDAFFARNDVEAIDVMAAAADLGHEVPESIGVIGYDDSALARRARPGLTSVQQRAEVLGARAVELLRSRIGGRSDDIHDVVEPRLRVRASTRSPTTAADDIG